MNIFVNNVSPNVSTNNMAKISSEIPMGIDVNSTFVSFLATQVNNQMDNNMAINSSDITILQNLPFGTLMQNQGNFIDLQNLPLNGLSQLHSANGEEQLLADANLAGLVAKIQGCIKNGNNAMLKKYTDELEKRFPDVSISSILPTVLPADLQPIIQQVEMNNGTQLDNMEITDTSNLQNPNINSNALPNDPTLSAYQNNVKDANTSKDTKEDTIYSNNNTTEDILTNGNNSRLRDNVLDNKAQSEMANIVNPFSLPNVPVEGTPAVLQKPVLEAVSAVLDPINTVSTSTTANASATVNTSSTVNTPIITLETPTVTADNPIINSTVLPVHNVNAEDVREKVVPQLSPVFGSDALVNSKTSNDVAKTSLPINGNVSKQDSNAGNAVEVSLNVAKPTHFVAKQDNVPSVPIQTVPQNTVELQVDGDVLTTNVDKTAAINNFFVAKNDTIMPGMDIAPVKPVFSEVVTILENQSTTVPDTAPQNNVVVTNKQSNVDFGNNCLKQAITTVSEDVVTNESGQLQKTPVIDSKDMKNILKSAVATSNSPVFSVNSATVKAETEPITSPLKLNADAIKTTVPTDGNIMLEDVPKSPLHNLQFSNSVSKEDELSVLLKTLSSKESKKDADFDSSTSLFTSNTENVKQHAPVKLAHLDSHFVKELIERFNALPDPGRTTLKVKLTPANLGELTINLIQKAGKVSIEIVTTNKQVEALLYSKSSALQTTFKESGVELEKYQVVYHGENAEGTSHNQNTNQNFDGSSKNPYVRHMKQDDSKNDNNEQSFAEMLAYM